MVQPPELDVSRLQRENVVLGTTSFIGEGFDAPALDTLILAAPGKDQATVHDYHDVRTPVLAASLERRMPGYRRLGFHRGA